MAGPGRRMGPIEKPKNVWKTIGRLISYMGKYRGFLLIVFVAVLCSSGAGVLGDSLLKPAINNYIVPLFNRARSGEVLSFVDFLPFLKMLAVMACIFAFGAFASWLNARLMLYISSRTLFRIRNDLFSEMELLPLKYFDSHTHGELMSLYTNDVDTLRDMMSQSVPQMFSGIVSVISVFVMMIIMSPVLTLIMVVTIIFMMFIAAAIGKKSAGAFRLQQQNLGKVNGYIEELIEGQKVVKVFNREEFVIDGFQALNDELCKSGTKANTYANILMPLMGNLSHIQYAIIAICGALMVISGRMDLGSIAAFLQYTRSFSRPITMMSQQFNGILNALAGAERIFKVIDEKNELDQGKVELVTAIKTNEGKILQTFMNTEQWAWKLTGGTPDNPELKPLNGDVVFENVSFGYVPEKEVLHNISLHAKPGQKIALVGSTGSGKTTITNLLTRFYDIEENKGTITYDGIPINQIKKDSLRKSLGMVLQDTHLFTGTIRENIRYGNLEASNKQVENAARLANAENFILHLPKGYDTMITGDGDSLSQGQRQLLAIARAAIADPPVLILDEATSSIDTRTEHLIEKGMDSLMDGRTVFVIAHRLSTVRNADVIIVLEKGNIIERGNHNQLMAQKGRYYKLYTGAFELS